MHLHWVPLIAIFTTRKRSLRRLCFYTCLSFCPWEGGGLPQYMLGYHPPRPGTPPLRAVPLDQAPPRAVPLDQAPPPQSSPPGPGTPQSSPPRPGPPPDQAHTPRSSACWEIRSTSGRYASYWNATLWSLRTLCNNEQIIFSEKNYDWYQC